MIDIRERVKAICKQRGITQIELAEKMGISRGALAVSLRPNRKTKRGNAVTYPSMDTLVRIAEALNVEVEDIFALGPVKGGTGNAFRCPCCGAELWVSAGK